MRHFSNARGDLGRAELCDEGLSIGLNCKYTFCMSMTTIRVRRELRDELKGQARAAGLSLGDYLQKLSDKAASENRLNAARVAMASTPQKKWESYVNESDAWDQTEWGDAGGNA